jgi:hypothetical protein
VQHTILGTINPDADLEERANGADGELSTTAGGCADFGTGLVEIQAASKIQRAYLFSYQGP